jgi:hypothetical protein
MSIPKKRRLAKLAAIPVVELPANGSKIHAPGLVDAKIHLYFILILIFLKKVNFYLKN